MNYLLDTNHWSYLQRRHPGLVSRLQSLPDDATLFMPVVAQAELLVGVELAAQGRRKRELRALYERTLRETTDILEITSAVAEKFAAVVAQLRQKGRSIETNDVWIAAIALEADFILVTSDAGFQYVDGLKLEDWTGFERES